MKYQNRDLPRLWECVVYTGDPNAKRPKTKKETVVAWNAVDANRKLAGMELAKEPKAVCFVWQEDPDDPKSKKFRIDDTSGPTDEEVKPSVEVEEEEF